MKKAGIWIELTKSAWIGNILRGRQRGIVFKDIPFQSQQTLDLLIDLFIYSPIDWFTSLNILFYLLALTDLKSELLKCFLFLFHLQGFEAAPDRFSWLQSICCRVSTRRKSKIPGVSFYASLLHYAAITAIGDQEVRGQGGLHEMQMRMGAQIAWFNFWRFTKHVFRAREDQILALTLILEHHL